MVNPMLTILLTQVLGQSSFVRPSNHAPPAVCHTIVSRSQFPRPGYADSHERHQQAHLPSQGRETQCCEPGCCLSASLGWVLSMCTRQFSSNLSATFATYNEAEGNCPKRRVRALLAFPVL